LRSKADFKAMRKGKRFNSGSIRLVFQTNGLGYGRLGLAVSRKYGNAVQRNRLKRKIRDIFRHSLMRETSMDILLIPTMNAERAYSAEDDFSRALKSIYSRMNTGTDA